MCTTIKRDINCQLLFEFFLSVLLWLLEGEKISQPTLKMQGSHQRCINFSRKRFKKKMKFMIRFHSHSQNKIQCLSLSFYFQVCKVQYWSCCSIFQVVDIFQHPVRGQNLCFIFHISPNTFCKCDNDTRKCLVESKHNKKKQAFFLNNCTDLM